MKKKLIILFSFAITYNTYAQTKAEDAIRIFEQKFPQEKVYILLDKNNYVAGDKLFFKSFVFDGYSSSNISTSLYVELYDKNKNPISKNLVPLIKGEGNGNISIPDNIKEDVYYLRAYTSWMTNFSEDFQLIKPVIIYNPSSQEKIVKKNNSMWVAESYPESGTFINGINTKFSVRLNTNGEALTSWSGYVIDIENPNQKITTFKNFDENVATFNLTPQLNKNYQVVVEDDNKQKQYISLPSVVNSGVNLHVISNTNEIKYSLKSNNLPKATSYKILGTINNQVVYKAKFNQLSDLSYSIPTDKLINGILQLTVFDDKENVIAERLSFIEPELLKIKQPSISTLALNNSPRKTNSFDISGEVTSTNYTIAIIDANGDNPEDEQSFLSTLWLTGDIKSKINKPAQYFTKNRNIEALDALLISEKWSRFNWKSIIAGDYPSIKKENNKYLSYKGTLTIDGKPAPKTDLNVILDSQTLGPTFYQVTSDNYGNFILDNVFFEDNSKISYQLNTDKKSLNTNVKVFLQPNYSFTPYEHTLPENQYKLVKRLANEKPNQKIDILIRNKNLQENINDKVTSLEEVKIKAEKNHKTQKLNEQLSSALFSSTSEEVFDFVNNKFRLDLNLLQWLQGRVAGLDIRQENGDFVPYLRGNRGRNKAEIYLNEARIEPSLIKNISPYDIAMVKVFKGYFAGSNPSNGAIAIYTRRGDLFPVSDSQFLSQAIIDNGYNKQLTYNSPNYDLEKFKNIQNDTRSLLYWNPSLNTSPNESTNINFFNNDIAKSYRLIILGFDKNNEVPLYYNEIFN